MNWGVTDAAPSAYWQPHAAANNIHDSSFLQAGR
jgi:hypothetical protein